MSGPKLVLLILLYITVTWGILAFLSGCGRVEWDSSAPNDYLHDYIAPDLQQETVRFVEEMENRGVRPGPLPEVIEWGVLLERGMVGVCERPARRVTLDVSLRGDFAGTRAVLHHELAHCMFNMDAHEDQPGHLMSEVHQPEMLPRTEHEWHAAWDRLAEFILHHSPLIRARRPIDVAGGY